MDTLILTSLLVWMGISTNQQRIFNFLQGIWLIGIIFEHYKNYHLVSIGTIYMYTTSNTVMAIYQL